MGFEIKRVLTERKFQGDYRSSGHFYARILLSSTDGIEDLEVWDNELTPLNGGSTRDWAKDHLYMIGGDELYKRFELSQCNCEILIEGKISGHYDYASGEWDEEIDIINDQHQILPNDYFDSKYEKEIV